MSTRRRRRPWTHWAGVACYGAALGLLLYLVVVERLRHPELTETQLFLRTWWQYLVAVALTFAAFLLLDGKRERRA